MSVKNSIINYEEILIKDEYYTNKKGEAEKIVQYEWANFFLDKWFINRIVPLHKPLENLAKRFPKKDWNNIINQLYFEQNEFMNFEKYLEDRCPKCGNEIICRQYNLSKVLGCNRYPSGACDYGKTFYFEETFERIKLISDGLVKRIKEELLKRLRIFGANGVPDIIGIKNDIFYFVEIKDFKEDITDEQFAWLNWLAAKPKCRSILIRVQSDK